MKKILLWVWQAPQNIVGLVFLGICKLRRRFCGSGILDGVHVIKLSSGTGVSLGSYVFVAQGCPENTVKHELGHCKQSKFFGPLYLLIIGLPSLSGNIYNRIKKRGSKWYYSRFPENWADKLGGVQRLT